MTKKEKKITKLLLKEMQHVLQHLAKTKTPLLPAKEVHLHILDETGEGMTLWCEAVINEETGDIEFERGMSEVSKELDIDVELEGDSDFDEEWDSSFDKPSSRLLN